MKAKGVWLEVFGKFLTGFGRGHLNFNKILAGVVFSAVKKPAAARKKMKKAAKRIEEMAKVTF